MSGRGKRIWSPRFSFDEAYDETLRFVKRAQEHKLVSTQPAALFQVYRLAGQWPIDGMRDLSHYLKFGFESNPQTDRARQALARLLPVALKAHFFLNPEALVTHEPYVFTQPDLAQPGQLRYGLVYPLEQDGKLWTILVAEWDLAMVASRQPKLPATERFPVVLPSDPFKRMPRKHWRALREEAEGKPWLDAAATGFARKKLMDLVQQHTDKATFPYGTLLDYPIELNDEVRAVGGLWAQGVRQWFLPSGWDVGAVKEYLDAQAHLSDVDRHALRWLKAVPAPKPRKPTTDAA